MPSLGSPQLALCAALTLVAGVAAAEAACLPGTEIARLVSMTGDVRINGMPLVGELPFVAMCAGDLVTVGANSRASIFLLEADTPLRLDEQTAARIEAPTTPDSGLFELARGAIYFLSEVRRTLTIKTPYVNAGIDGTEVYVRVADSTSHGPANAELIVLEGEVSLKPGDAQSNGFAGFTAMTGDRVQVDAQGRARRTSLPSPGEPYEPLRDIIVGELSWTLFYPDVLTGDEAAQYPEIGAAARLLAAGRALEAEALLAQIPDGAATAGLRDALLAIVAFGRRDGPAALRLAGQAVAAAPDSAVAWLATSYARQLAIDLEGALAAARQAARVAPRSALSQARLAELHLMRGEVRQAREAAHQAVELGGGPLAQIVLGFSDLAALRAGRAELAFREALSTENANPLALLGLGLALIKQGQLQAGTVQIASAVANDPSSSLLRSYLGKANFDDGRDHAALKQFAIAKALDPADPTPWFYNAILLQLDNQPVAALRDIDRSIQLNDERRFYRSPALLGEDAAARGASLARIYDDLGFTQLGVNAAADAIARAPASSVAQRFLADIYQAQPRAEVARASALLQSQLLQPVGRNTVQPSLAVTDLDVVQRGGPLTVSFNEYNPLFAADGLQLDATALGGTESTFGGEYAVTGLYGRTGFSVGQLRYQTDGFRDNADLSTDVVLGSVQTMIGDDVTVTGQLVRRETDKGDRSFVVPEFFDPDLDVSRDETLALLGGHWRIAPGSDLLVAGQIGDRDVHTSSNQGDGVSFSDDIRFKDQRDGVQLESAYLMAAAFGTATLGGGAYETDAVFRFTEDFEVFDDPSQNGSAKIREHRDYDGQFAYSYANLTPTPNLTLTLGLGADRYQQPGYDSTRALPKLGLVYSPRPYMTFRAAAFETLKRGSVSEASLEPVQIAGFNQLSDEYSGTRIRTVAAGVDVRPSGWLAIGIEGIDRDLSPPLEILTDPGDRNVKILDQHEQIARLYLYATALERFAFTTGVEGSWFSQPFRDAGQLPTDIDTWSLPSSVRYFHPSGLIAEATLTYLRQSVSSYTQGQSDRTQDESTDDAFLLDLGLGYRFPQRRGMFSVEVHNALDQDLAYQDDAFRTSEPTNLDERSDPVFFPDRTIVARLTLRF